MAKVLITLTGTASSKYTAPQLFELVGQKLDATPGNGQWNTNTIDLDAVVNNENKPHPLLQDYVGTSRRLSLGLKQLADMPNYEK